MKDAFFNYAKGLVQKAGKDLLSGQVFAKVLTSNDDSGRHGVLIPSDAYAFFPDLPIPDATKNATETFVAFDVLAKSWKTVCFKYYERYPERRITRVNGLLNDLAGSPRLFVALCAKHSDGTTAYYFDFANSGTDGRFAELFLLIFGQQIEPLPGKFILRPIDAPAFAADAPLQELLGLFDVVKARGWVDAMRSGDTGIGYTFETLLGIKENNDQIADFKGIEIKCQALKEGRTQSPCKINLFQAGPTWLTKSSAKQRIRALGKQGPNKLYSCYSQVSTAANNLGLLLNVMRSESNVDLRKHSDRIAYWPFARLEKRLAEKHSRAAFVKAQTRTNGGTLQFSYEELVYCDKPSIERFIDLVDRRNIVFEFIMSERANGQVRNHGYPWRLIRAQLLDQLFAFQIKLR